MSAVKSHLIFLTERVHDLEITAWRELWNPQIHSQMGSSDFSGREIYCSFGNNLKVCEGRMVE